MSLAAPLALLVLLAAPEEVRGAAGTLPEARPSRNDPRLRWGLSASALFGLTNEAPNGGVGFIADVGVSLIDRVALLVRAELGTAVVSLMGSGALCLEYTFDDRFTAGLGVAFTAWAPTFFSGPSRFLGLTVPFRLSFAPTGRAADQVRREGLVLSLQVAPGINSLPGDYDYPWQASGPQPAFAATLGLGYAWW